MGFVMEGNSEFRVDGEAMSSINHLGSEDSFNFYWGWRRLFSSHKGELIIPVILRGKD